MARLQAHDVGIVAGAWRMAAACFDDCAAAFERFEHGYIEASSRAR